MIKEKVVSTAKRVDLFFDEANAKLAGKASSTEEILNFKQNYSDLSRRRQQTEKIIKERNELNAILKKISGVGLNFSRTDTKSREFDELMSKYTETIESQKEEIKKDLQKRLLAIDSELENFLSKWNGVKPNEKSIPDEFSFKQFFP